MCIFLLYQENLKNNYFNSLDNLSRNEIYLENRASKVIDNDYKLLKEVPGVDKVFPVYRLQICKINKNGIDITLNQPIEVIPYYEFQKDYLSKINDKGSKIYVSKLAAKDLELNKSDDIIINNSGLKINRFEHTEILDDMRLTHANSRSTIYIDYELFNDIDTSQVILKLSSFKYFENISKTINDINPNYIIRLSQNKYFDQIETYDLYTKNVNTFCMIISIIVAVILSISQSFNVYNKKYEIAILKANGLNRKEILILMVNFLISNIIIDFSWIVGIILGMKFLLSFLNIALVTITFKFMILIVGFLFVIYIFPTLITLIFILRCDAEKLLRF